MMDFNWRGELTKCEVAALLSKRGYNIKDENDLNPIMEEMGLLVYSEGQWSTTEKAVKYICSNSQVFGEVLWSPSVLDDIYKFLD